MICNLVKNQKSSHEKIFKVSLALIFLYAMNLNVVRAQEMHASNTSPVYPGGKSALKEFIDKNLRYPEEAKRTGISGVVEVGFMINKNGEVENIKVMKGISPECDAEALRVTGLIKGWTQGFRQGKPVNTLVSMPVEFRGKNKIQPTVITGKVTERITGKPLEGTFVIIKGTNIGSVTGPDGTYRLEVTPDSKILECFGVGYSAKEVTIDYHSIINIELDTEYFILDFNTPDN
jgi:TonB family protein